MKAANRLGHYKYKDMHGKYRIMIGSSTVSVLPKQHIEISVSEKYYQDITTKDEVITELLLADTGVERQIFPRLSLGDADLPLIEKVAKGMGKEVKQTTRGLEIWHGTILPKKEN